VVQHDPRGPLAVTAAAEEIDGEIRSLYREYAPGLARYATVVMGGADGAPDAVQEVFLRYFIERSYGRRIDIPRAWLYHVLRNFLLDRLKAARARPETAASDVARVRDQRHNPEERLHRSEMAREIAGALSAR
jgi:RNA polymerase sigma factor (sigma-70 family)